MYKRQFQTLSYSIDVYRRDVKAERNIINFGACLLYTSIPAVAHLVELTAPEKES